MDCSIHPVVRKKILDEYNFANSLRRKSVGAFNDPDANKWTTPIREWRDGNLDAARLTEDYITSKVAPFNTANSAFWVIPFLIAGAFISIESNPQDLAHSFAWSNLYKVS